MTAVARERTETSTSGGGTESDRLRASRPRGRAEKEAIG